MNLGTVGVASGWLVAALVVATVPLPYLLRGRLLAPAGWGGLSYLERLRPHYWIGYTIAGLGFLHAGVAMSAPLPLSRNGYFAGLWLATAVMLLSFGQVMVGRRMRSLRGGERLRLRRLHFWVMVLLVTGGLAHIVLNAPI